MSDRPKRNPSPREPWDTSEKAKRAQIAKQVGNTFVLKPNPKRLKRQPEASVTSGQPPGVGKVKVHEPEMQTLATGTRTVTLVGDMGWSGKLEEVSLLSDGLRIVKERIVGGATKYLVAAAPEIDAISLLLSAHFDAQLAIDLLLSQSLSAVK